MSDYGEAEDRARAALRDLVQSNGQTIFGSRVTEVEDTGESDTTFHVWTDSSGEWQITVERASPPPGNAG
jgi:hypothetical protein